MNAKKKRIIRWIVFGIVAVVTSILINVYIERYEYPFVFYLVGLFVGGFGAICVYEED